jgi:DDE superfamily endonuclease
MTGRDAKRVLFGALHLATRHRVGRCRQSAGGTDARASLSEVRSRYRQAPRIWLLLDRASAPTDTRTLRLAGELGMELVGLPRQWPELNAMDHRWKELKRLMAANRQAAHIEQRAEEAPTRSPAQSGHPLSGVLASRSVTRSLSTHLERISV